MGLVYRDGHLLSSSLFSSFCLLSCKNKKVTFVLYYIDQSSYLAYHSFLRQPSFQKLNTINMKYSVIALALFSGVALAQSSLPECAQPCIADAVPSVTDCALDDQACQCEPANKSAIQAAATTCVLTNCKEKALGMFLNLTDVENC